MTPRPLSESEIKEILDSIARPRIGTRLADFDAEAMYNVLRPVELQLRSIELEPSMYPKLRDTIVGKYYTALIPPRTALGISAAHANLEPVSQAVLKLASDASRAGAAANMNNSLEIIETTKSPKLDWIAFSLYGLGGLEYDPTYCENFAKNMIVNNLGHLATRVELDGELVFQCFNLTESLRRGLHPIALKRQFLAELSDKSIGGIVMKIVDNEIMIHVPGQTIWDLNRFVTNHRKQTKKSEVPYDYQIAQKPMNLVIGAVMENRLMMTGPIALRRAALATMREHFNIRTYNDVDVTFEEDIDEKALQEVLNKPMVTIILSCSSNQIINLINKHPEIDFNTIVCADMNVFNNVFGIGTTRGCFEQRYVDAVPPDDLPAQVYVMMICNYVTGMGPVLQKITRATVAARGPLPAAAAENPVNRFYTASLRARNYATTDTTTELMLGIPPTQTGTSSVRLKTDPKVAAALLARNNIIVSGTTLPLADIRFVSEPL